MMLTLSLCSDFVRHELQRGFQGAVYSDVAEFGRFATALAGELDGGAPTEHPGPPPVHVPGVGKAAPEEWEAAAGLGMRQGTPAGSLGLSVLPIARSGKQTLGGLSLPGSPSCVTHHAAHPGHKRGGSKEPQGLPLAPHTPWFAGEGLSPPTTLLWRSWGVAVPPMAERALSWCPPKPPALVWSCWPVPSCEVAVLGSGLCGANPAGRASSAGQVCICILCALLMRTRQAWLFAAPLLPVLARLCGVPLHALPLANTFAAILTSVEVLYVLSSHILVPFQLAAAACREVLQVSGAAGSAGRSSCPGRSESLPHTELLCPAGHGAVPPAGAGGVSLEPAVRPPPLPRFLAGALLPAALLLPGLLRQPRGPAGAAVRPAQQVGAPRALPSSRLAKGGGGGLRAGGAVLSPVLAAWPSAAARPTPSSASPSPSPTWPWECSTSANSTCWASVPSRTATSCTGERGRGRGEGGGRPLRDPGTGRRRWERWEPPPHSPLRAGG